MYKIKYNNVGHTRLNYIQSVKDMKDRNTITGELKPIPVDGVYKCRWIVQSQRRNVSV